MLEQRDIFRAVIDIDGSFGEGGGQIVRTACSLAALTGSPCRIFNIRQARREPGLRLQHLLAAKTLAELTGGSLQGGQIGSRELVFNPGQAMERDFWVRVGTAASITLIAQCLIPAALSLSKPIRVRFSGGATDTAFSPALDYFRHVFLWFLQRMDLKVTVSVERRGYYPRGGAEVVMLISPAKPIPIAATERGTLKEIRLASSAASVLGARKVAERQVEGALATLGSLPIAPRAEIEYSRSMSAGSALCIVGEFEQCAIGADALGARGKMAEQVGCEAATQFLAELKSAACLDRRMGDQILPYMALAGRGGSATVSEITGHCRTNMWVIEKFLNGSFEVRQHLIRWNSS